MRNTFSTFIGDKYLLIVNRPTLLFLLIFYKIAFSKQFPKSTSAAVSAPRVFRRIE